MLSSTDLRSRNTMAPYTAPHYRPRIEIPQASKPIKQEGGALKRSHDAAEDDAVDQKPPARKRITLPRKGCIVCPNNVATNQFPRVPHAQVKRDGHDSDVCRKCYQQHLGNEFKNKDQEAVSCPHCAKPLVQSEVQKLTSSQMYQEYAERLCNCGLGQEANADSWCRYLDKAVKECLHEAREEEEFRACPNAACTWG